MRSQLSDLEKRSVEEPYDTGLAAEDDLNAILDLQERNLPKSGGTLSARLSRSAPHRLHVGRCHGRAARRTGHFGGSRGYGDLLRPSLSGQHQEDAGAQQGEKGSTVNFPEPVVALVGSAKLHRHV